MELRYNMPLIHYLQVFHLAVTFIPYTTIGACTNENNESNHDDRLISIQNAATNRAAYFVATIFNHRYNHSWSSLRLDDIGFKIGGVFEPFSWLKQSVQWRASWRQLQPLPSSDPISFKHANGKLYFSISTFYPDKKQYSNIFVLTFVNI